MKNNAWKRILHLVLFAVLVFLDQLSKAWAIENLKGKNDIVAIPGLLRFSYLENTGAIWGVFGGKTVFLLIFTTIMLGAIIVFYFRVPMKKRYLPVRIILIAIAAGALGNIIDRFRFKHVTDFISFEFIQFPTFNVADIYITVSVFVAVFLLFFVYKEEFDDTPAATISSDSNGGNTSSEDSCGSGDDSCTERNEK